MAGMTQVARYYTSHQVGNLLQVNPSSVVKWINDGLLQAFRTPVAIDASQRWNWSASRSITVCRSRRSSRA
jgi:hypothetical protein